MAYTEGNAHEAIALGMAHDQSQIVDHFRIRSRSERTIHSHFDYMIDVFRPLGPSYRAMRHSQFYEIANTKDEAPE